jgi:transcriptional regulator with XRE-family HTH domain
MLNNEKQNEQASNIRIEVGRRIKEARTNKGLSAAQVSRATGFSPGRISNWERGTKLPNFESAETLASLLDVSPNWILCIDASLGVAVDPKLNANNFDLIPVLDISGKNPFSELSPIDYLPVCKSLAKKIDPVSSYFAIFVADDSMTPFYKIDDVIVFERLSNLIDKDCVLIQLRSSNELMFRQIHLDGNEFVFTPLNPAWPKTLLDKEEQFNILGRVPGKLNIFF